MERYLGIKEVKAKPMTRQEYNELRGWTLPANEDGNDKGYLVEYVDGGKANTEQYAGYVSWSPEDVFNRAYKPSGYLMSFGTALVALEEGLKVARSGWNGKGMYLALQEGSVLPAEHARSGVAKCLAAEGKEDITINPHIDMRAADGTCVVGWLASQTDMLAKDWVIVTNKG